MAECIEREAVFSAIWKTSAEHDVFFPAIILDAIKTIPAADVRPVLRGKWLPDYDYAEYDFDGITPLPEPRKFQDGWQCSLCGEYMPSETGFCPNCGADMRAEEGE